MAKLVFLGQNWRDMAGQANFSAIGGNPTSPPTRGNPGANNSANFLLRHKLEISK